MAVRASDAANINAQNEERESERERADQPGWVPNGLSVKARAPFRKGTPEDGKLYMAGVHPQPVA